MDANYPFVSPSSSSRWWFVSGMRDYVRELGDGKTLVGYGCMKCTGGRIISQPFVLKRVGKEKGWWRGRMEGG